MVIAFCCMMAHRKDQDHSYARNAQKTYCQIDFDTKTFWTFFDFLPKIAHIDESLCPHCKGGHHNCQKVFVHIAWGVTTTDKKSLSAFHAWSSQRKKSLCPHCMGVNPTDKKSLSALHGGSTQQTKSLCPHCMGGQHNGQKVFVRIAWEVTKKCSF